MNHDDVDLSKSNAVEDFDRFRLDLPLSPAELDLMRLPGVGPKTAERLVQRGIEHQGDLVLLLPRAFRTTLRFATPADIERQTPEHASVGGVIVRASRFSRHSRRPFEVIIERGGARLVAVWFNVKRKAFADQFEIGRSVTLEGAVSYDRTLPRMSHPSVRFQLTTDQPQLARDPVYPSFEGVPDAVLKRAVTAACAALLPSLEGTATWSGITLAEALRLLHGLLPDGAVQPDADELELARRRVAYEELLHAQSRLAAIAASARRRAGPALRDAALRDRMLGGLPFTLTKSQQAVVGLLSERLGEPHPMRMLLQGDVGSGKTVVACVAMCIACGSGPQVAMMAPSEVLVSQHARTVRELVEPLGLRVEEFTSSLGGGARRSVLERLRTGAIDVIVGTQALLSADVTFSPRRDLGLVIVDEQHKFGVAERARLVDRANSPNFLGMTATPLPRTLVHSLFGDLELAVLDERPSGPPNVQTHLRHPEARAKIYGFLRSEAAAGARAFVVFPSIDPFEHRRGLLAGAEDLANGPLAGLRMGVLHGRMGGADKASAIRRFSGGELDVLFCTTIVEVGIDIPEANIVVVEDADMFGVAQLHQLRGRVGRAGQKSHCIVVAGSEATDVALRRLQAFSETNDGFALAEADLTIRGPGEYAGVRQAGRSEFRFAVLPGDGDILNDARAAARRAEGLPSIHGGSS